METVKTDLQEELRDTLSDWAAVNSAKRLRGCLLHCARIYRRHGHDEKAAGIERRVKNMPRGPFTKEAINAVLWSACQEFGLLQI